MSYFDLINALRMKDVKPEKAAKAMKILAAVCLVGGIWNYVVVLMAPFDRTPIKIDPNFPSIALITGVLLAGLFFLASRGINDRTGWGKKLGQLAVVLFVASCLAGFYSMFSNVKAPFGMFPAPVLIVFSVIFAAQFIVPAYFGIQYLGRLPIDENSYARPDTRPDTVMHAPAPLSECAQTPQRYKEALLPFGVVGTFVIQMVIFMVVMMVAQKYAGPAVFAAFFAVVFLGIFIGPSLYNKVPSSFERARTIVASYTGGGSMLMFNGSWPFFRLLVYDDGVEVRVMFHRFFIPYDKMEDLPEKMGFFSSGVPFKSDLPGVPSSIRFSGFGSKKILEFVKEQRKRFLARKSG